MNVLAALSYGDRRAALNTIRSLPRRPGRLALWSLYAFAVFGFALIKSRPHPHAPVSPAALLPTTIDDLWVCGLAIAFGFVLASGTSRWLGVFTSRAEALLITRSHAAPLAVAAYLQTRAVLATLTQSFARFAYLIVLGVPSGSSAVALIAQLCFFAAAGAAIASVALPRALARGWVRIALIALGITIVVAAALPLAADLIAFLRLEPAFPAMTHLRIPHPGGAMLALAAGDLRATLIPLGIAAIATAAFTLAARDAYPELYAVSLANLEWRARPNERRPAEGGATARPAVRTARSTRGAAMRGALAYLWVDALMYARRVTPALTAVVAALALGGGAAFGLFAHQNAELAFGILTGTLPGLAIAIASTTGIRLAPALRMPLFWLGDVPLAARLAAWAAGAWWRDVVLVALAVGGYAGVGGNVRSGLLVLAAGAALLALTRAVGLAVFALLPDQLDQRGPAVMLRVLLSFVLVAPAALAAAIAAFVSRVPFMGATLAGTAVAAGEAALLVAFAAWRLAGRVDRLTTSG